MRKYQRPDLHKAINEAFRVAERRLYDLKEQLDDRSKGVAHDAESQSLGQVAEVSPEEDFGFLLTKEGSLLYFHRNSVLSGNAPAIHVLLAERKTWMPGPRPGMTIER